MNKKAVELSFAWIFAAIAGAVIIILAIYFSSNLIGVGCEKVNTQLAKQLTIVFDPFETSLSSAKSSAIKLNEELKINNKCSLANTFGYSEVSVHSKCIGEKWSKEGLATQVSNKYIFSENIEQGKTLYLLAKPFQFPYKVSEMLILTTKKYCFYSPPESIEEDIKSIGLRNIEVTTQKNCSASSIKVCFDNEDDYCNILVFPECEEPNCNDRYEQGRVIKNSKELYFVDNLLYPAIFSSPSIYECNLARLVKRTSQLALLYKDEVVFRSNKGCPGAELQTSLDTFFSLTSEYADSQDLPLLFSNSKELNKLNELAICSLWENV